MKDISLSLPVEHEFYLGSCDGNVTTAFLEADCIFVENKERIVFVGNEKKTCLIEE